METKVLSPVVTDWEQVRGIIGRTCVTQDAEVERLQEQLDAAKTRNKSFRLAKLAMAGVLKDWKMEDPGEYVPAFFLRSIAGRALAKELLSAEELELAKSMPSEKNSYPLLSLNEMEHSKCPQCVALLPVFEQYLRHSDDGVDQSLFVICPVHGCGDR